MRAVVFDEPGGPEVMRMAECADPVPGEGEVLVEVEAAGVNRADVLQRRGRYPPPPGASPILGLEIAGRVAAGSGGEVFSSGDRVMAVVTGGGYATRCVAPESVLLPIPEVLGFEEAAAVPESFLTAWLNLVDLGRLEAGQTVLIHAGASGVGSAAIQLARTMGARILATAGSDRKLDFCRALGAERAIHRKREQFADVVRDLTGGRGVDLVLDVAGAPYFGDNLASLRRGGRLVLIGFLGGAGGDLDLGPILRKNLTVTGTTLRATPVAEKARLVREFGASALPGFSDGTLKPLVDRVFRWEEAGEAHAYMEADGNAGALVLRVGS